MTQARRVCLSVCLLALAGGCGPTARPTARPAGSADGPISMADPCPTRLHEISGALLLHYRLYNRSPGTLEELRKLPGFEQSIQTTCPVSGKPYLYNADGLLETPTAVVIVADPLPSHAGSRWAISVPETQGNALVTKIIAIPEERFRPAAR